MTAIHKLKSILKRIPFVEEIYRALRGKPGVTPESYEFRRVQWQDGTSEKASRRQRVLNVLNYTKTSGTSFAAERYPAGYHSIKIDGEIFEGQRKPHDRLKLIPIDFKQKTVLDIGCNQGGMIFALAGQVKWAVGVDFDPRMVNTCNFLRNNFSHENSYFYVFDIDKDPHELLRDFLPEDRVDVVFLLSVCMWVDKWRELISFCSQISNQMVLETNGSDRQQQEQITFLESVYSKVTLLADESQDDPGQRKRKLFLAQVARRPA